MQLRFLKVKMLLNNALNAYCGAAGERDLSKSPVGAVSALLAIQRPHERQVPTGGWFPTEERTKGQRKIEGNSRW